MLASYLAFSSAPGGVTWHCYNVVLPCCVLLLHNWYDKKPPTPFHCPHNPTYKSFPSDPQNHHNYYSHSPREARGPQGPRLGRPRVSSQAWLQVQCSFHFPGLSCKEPLSLLFQDLHFTGEKSDPCKFT